MRELDRRLAESVRPLLAGARSLLLVGAQGGALSAHLTLTALEDVGALRERAVYEAGLWVAPADALALRVGVTVLRAHLAPGARLLLAVRRRPPVLNQVRGLLGGPAPRPIKLEELCGALLLSGLLRPRVHVGPRGWHVLSAALPSATSELDVFFAQPSPP